MAEPKQEQENENPTAPAESGAPAPAAEAQEFDLLAFWIQYKNTIIRLCYVVLIAAGAYFGYELWQKNRIANSKSALAAAKTPDEFRRVMQDWEGLAAAGTAQVYLAQALQRDGKTDDAVKELRAFVAKNPQHSLLHEAQSAIAGLLHGAGKTDEALAAYEQIAATTTNPHSLSAIVSQARILVAKGKADDAKKLLEKLQSEHMGTPAGSEAGSILKDLANPNGLKTGGTPRPPAPPAPPTPGAPNAGGPRIQPPVVTPSAIPQPVPSAPPVQPATPQPPKPLPTPPSATQPPPAPPTATPPAQPAPPSSAQPPKPQPSTPPAIPPVPPPAPPK